MFEFIDQITFWHAILLGAFAFFVIGSILLQDDPIIKKLEKGRSRASIVWKICSSVSYVIGGIFGAACFIAIGVTLIYFPTKHYYIDKIAEGPVPQSVPTSEPVIAVEKKPFTLNYQEDDTTSSLGSSTIPEPANYSDKPTEQPEPFGDHFAHLPERHKSVINLLPREARRMIVSKINNSASLDEAKASSEKEIKSIATVLSKLIESQLNSVDEYNLNVEIINKIIPALEGLEQEIIRMRQFRGPDTNAKFEFESKKTRIKLNSYYRECDMRRQKIIEIQTLFLNEGYCANKSPLILLPNNTTELAAVKSGSAPLPLSGSDEKVMLKLRVNDRLLNLLQEIKYKSILLLSESDN